MNINLLESTEGYKNNKKRKTSFADFQRYGCFSLQESMLIISVLFTSLSILSLILKLHFVNLNEIIKKKNNTSALLQEAILARNNALIRYRRSRLIFSMYRLRKCPDCNCKL